MAFFHGCFDKSVVHGYKVFKQRDAEIPVWRCAGRIRTGDQEGTVQVALYLVTVYRLPTVG